MDERMDELLRAVADEADRGVDYSAMRSAALKKAESNRRKLNGSIIRYGSIAAALVVLLGASSLLMHGMGSSKSGDMMKFAAGEAAAPQASEPEAMQDACTVAGAGEVDENGEANDAGLLGSAPNRAPEPAPEPAESGAPAEYSSGAGLYEEPVGLPETCRACEPLYWLENSFELPGVEFGGEQTEQSDEERYVATIQGCTAEDAAAYARTVTDWLGADVTRGEQLGEGDEYIYEIEANGRLIKIECREDTLTVTVTLVKG